MSADAVRPEDLLNLGVDALLEGKDLDFSALHANDPELSDELKRMLSVADILAQAFTAAAPPPSSRASGHARYMDAAAKRPLFLGFTAVPTRLSRGFSIQATMLQFAR